MNGKFAGRDGKPQPMIMGCYGLGISRTLMASVEQHSNENGIVWPKEIAPFKVHIVPINLKDEDQYKLAYEIYENLKSSGIEVLIDDRAERAGSKFKDADLIGIPFRVVVGKDAKDLKVEFTDRLKGEKELILASEILALI